MKYIVAEVDSLEVAILFHEYLSHAQMQGAVGTATKILGAGFCSLDIDCGIVVSVWGRSVTLNCNSRGAADAAAIQKIL